MKEPGKWFYATGIILPYSSGVQEMKAVKEIISVQLLMKGKNMIKHVTGCMEEMLFPINVKRLLVRVIHRYSDLITKVFHGT